MASYNRRWQRGERNDTNNYSGDNQQDSSMRRSYSKKPPRGSWQPSLPSWEKAFCKKVGTMDWRTFVDTKKYVHLYPNVLDWNDSAGEEAFHNAKKRFLADVKGIPCDIPLPDPDLYIDEIDWDPKIDPKLIADLEDKTSVPAGEKHESVVIFSDSLLSNQALTPTGWGEPEENVNKTAPLLPPINHVNPWEHHGWGDTNQNEWEDTNHNGWGDTNQNGWGDTGQNGLGDTDQTGWGDTGQNGWGDADQTGWGDTNQNGWGDADQNGWGDINQNGWGDADQNGWGDANQNGWGDAGQNGWGDTDQNGWGDSQNTLWSPHEGTRGTVCGGWQVQGGYDSWNWAPYEYSNYNVHVGYQNYGFTGGAWPTLDGGHQKGGNAGSYMPTYPTPRARGGGRRRNYSKKNEIKWNRESLSWQQPTSSATPSGCQWVPITSCAPVGYLPPAEAAQAWDRGKPIS